MIIRFTEQPDRPEVGGVRVTLEAFVDLEDQLPVYRLSALIVDGAHPLNLEMAKRRLCQIALEAYLEPPLALIPS